MFTGATSVCKRVLGCFEVAKRRAFSAPSGCRNCMLNVADMSIVDVYTREPIRTPSEEHVVHNFLGGRLLCPDIIDKETNDKFGAGIDAKLHQSWRPILV